MRYLIVLLLAGCAMTPNELREGGDHSQHASSSPPLKVAQCLAAKAEDYADHYAAVWREKGRGYEVAVRMRELLVIVADVTPAGAGSATTVRVWPYMGDALREDLKQLPKGC